MNAQNMEKTFNPQAIENDIYKEWEEGGAFIAHREEGDRKSVV